MLALRIHGMLADGNGGVDWSGFPLACAYFGVRDPAALIHRVLVIKLHRPPDEGNS